MSDELLEKLTVEYFYLDHGILIENYLELLKIAKVSESADPNHPHLGMNLFISRRALKHFVESRKKELLVHHSEEKTLELLLFATKNLKEIICDFDSYEYRPPNCHFYLKDYSHIGKSNVRILVENVNEKLEIVSIHFKKNTKKKKAV